MKPPKSKSERNLDELRVTRKVAVHSSHGEGHGWAVSYADLLMVLLCFFILYFNFSDANNPDAPIDALKKISMAAKGIDVSDDTILKKKALDQLKPQENISDLAQVLELQGVSLTNRKDHLVIDLGKGRFMSGSFVLGGELKSEVDHIVSILKPHLGAVMVTVIGHADSRPLKRKKNGLLQDNFDLSSFRALHVLKYMIGHGVPENRSSARAASSFDRDARSVSIEVRLAQATAAEKTTDKSREPGGKQ